MKFKFLFIGLLALLASGCADQIMAVPKAAVDGVVGVGSAIWNTVTGIF